MRHPRCLYLRRDYASRACRSRTCPPLVLLATNCRRRPSRSGRPTALTCAA